MIVNYKGFEINVTREKCMAGYDMIYRNVLRLSDLWLFWGDYSDDGDSVREHVKSMKQQIDHYLSNPEQYEIEQEEYYKMFSID